MKIIKLNVGGVDFVTSQSTLNKDRPNLFDQLQNYENSPFDHIGDVFYIDRDASVFIYVLNYLRGYTLNFKDCSKNLLALILDDAKYFHLKELITIIEDVLDPKLTIGELKSELQSLDSDYSQEFRIHNLDNAPEGYKSLIALNKNELRTDISQYRECLKDQIKHRQYWLKEWKTKRYCNSFRKIVISFCTLLEYMAPTSPFTKNLSETVLIKLNSGQLKETITDIATNYVEDEGKEMSPTTRLVINLIVLIYMQGLLQPEHNNVLSKESDNKELNIESLIRMHPELEPAYEQFKKTKRH